MKNRRNFGKSVLASTLMLTLNSARSQTTSSSLKGSSQSEFLFWIGEAERADAKKTAEFILSQLDATPMDTRRLQILYGQGSTALTTRYSESTFSQRMMTTRAPLGVLKERVMLGIDGGYRKLPNINEGEYVIVNFASNFQAFSDIFTEQVTLGREGGPRSAWKFVEYYVAKKPYYSY